VSQYRKYLTDVVVFSQFYPISHMTQTSTHDNDLMGVNNITKKSLNTLTGHRAISIQEACHEIARLELTICSDYMSEVRLGKALRAKRGQSPLFKKNDKDLVECYRHRSSKLEGMSLEQYFYEVFRVRKFYKDADSGREKYRILVAKGLNCRPRFPVDYNYARGMLIMHKPWSKRNPIDELLRDKDETISVFKRMLEDATVLPLHVLSEYYRAVKYSQQYKIEALAKEATESDCPILDEMDADELGNQVQWEHCNFFSSGSMPNASTKVGNTDVDIGLDHNWSEPFFKGARAAGTMDGEAYTDWLRTQYYVESSSDNLDIPMKKVPSPTGSKTANTFEYKDYELEDLTDEQQVIVLAAIDTVIKFLTNDADYRPMRATIVGCGGTGKSYIINTLISVIRRLTKCNDVIKVAAPSGGAAYNVKGCTLHRGLDIAVDSRVLSKPLSDERQQKLATQLERLLMLVVDERSMLSSEIIAAAERNVRHCIYGQQNTSEYWGGLPVVLIFGDDYQLFPVASNGAIQGFSKRLGLQVPRDSNKSPNEQIMENEGSRIFIDDMTDHVFHLTKNFRVKDEVFKGILDRLRVGEATDDDAKRLMNLHFYNYSTEEKDHLENLPGTMWLYTHREMANEKNKEKLATLANKTKVPVAKLKCHWQSNRIQGKGQATASRSHFKNQNLVLQTDICVGASVAISGINIVPEVGLYNGARGTVIDIVYDDVVGPNNKHQYHLPRYVVVDFPGLKLPQHIPPWDKNHPTVSSLELFDTLCCIFPESQSMISVFKHVPIRMVEQGCSKNPGHPCCSVHYCPLILSWATTVHKFQGFEAGFDVSDSINRIIADVNDLEWEKKCPGTAYVVTSRAKTLGNATPRRPHPMDSALYFQGNFGQPRFKDILRKMNGDTCLLVKKRQAWVDFLHQRGQITAEKFNAVKRSQLRMSISDIMSSNPIESQTDLHKRIVNVIQNPNEKWRELRSRQYTVPDHRNH
jgi:hypothetical protein